MATRKLAAPAKMAAKRHKKALRAEPADGALLADLRQLIQDARRTAAVAVNMSLTMLYWRVGKRILDEVLGAQRADDGEQIVATLSRQLAGRQ